jgi:hypothetical protein
VSVPLSHLTLEKAGSSNHVCVIGVARSSTFEVSISMKMLAMRYGIRVGGADVRRLSWLSRAQQASKMSLHIPE